MYYKVCNMCYKVCNKKYLIRKEKIAAQKRKNVLYGWEKLLRETRCCQCRYWKRTYWIIKTGCGEIFEVYLKAAAMIRRICTVSRFSYMIKRILERVLGKIKYKKGRKGVILQVIMRGI